MQSNLKVALKVMGMALFASLLCLFVQVSIHTMMKSFTTEPVGYEVHEVKEDGSSVDHGIISFEDAPHLAGEYAAYGKVTEGMEVVNEIAECDTDYSDKPLDPQVIKSIVVDTLGVEYPQPEKM